MVSDGEKPKQKTTEPLHKNGVHGSSTVQFQGTQIQLDGTMGTGFNKSCTAQSGYLPVVLGESTTDTPVSMPSPFWTALALIGGAFNKCPTAPAAQS